jgi:FkbM family methyltransferase
LAACELGLKNMPSFRKQAIACVTRWYPFYSGCGTIANSPYFQTLAGPEEQEDVWVRAASGARLIAPLGDYVGRSMFFFGDLDPKISWVCSRLVSEGDIVLDIGANLGLVTMHLASLVGPYGHVHAFEPNPRLVDRLKQVLIANNASNVTLHPVALGACDGELPLFVPDENAGAASLVTSGHSSVPGTMVRVPVTTLTAKSDAWRGLHVRLIKIDVEGYEPEVLRGAAEFLASSRPDAIIFELNEHSGPLREHATIKILREADYRFFSIPKRLVRMRVVPWNPGSEDDPPSHDFVAAPSGTIYAEIGRSLRAGRFLL